MNEIIKQFDAMKAVHPDAIMIFRNGENYTCIKEDASRCAEVIHGWHPLVPEFDESGEMYLTISFPKCKLEAYLPMLVRKGHRVAICEPLEKAV